MNLGELGEFGLIDLIRRKVYAKDKRVVLNIGDDAALLKFPCDKFLVFTTDTMIEGVHFNLRYCPLKDVGWKSMAANLSDIAAMGGIPLAGLVSLGLPKRIKVEQVLKLYSGMKILCSKFKCPIVGGDIFSSPQGLVVTISLLGEVEKNIFRTRGGAKAGDLIYVTGNLGEAEAGLRLLKMCKRERGSITKKHLTPYPRVAESRLLVKNLRISAMIDISDGLSSDLHHICEESRKGALIFADKIPVSPKIKKFSRSLKVSPLDLALGSGEEYELLFTLNPKDQAKLKKVKKGKFKVTLIGKMKSQKEGVKISGLSGKIGNLKKSGYTHF